MRARRNRRHRRRERRREAADSNARRRVFAQRRNNQEHRVPAAGGDDSSRRLPAGALARGRSLPKSDIAILNFALTLEYLEAASYKEAVIGGALSGPTQSFAELIAQHEKTHVITLRKILGGHAIKKPTGNFKGTTMDQGKFQHTAFVLESRRPSGQAFWWGAEYVE